VISSITQYRVSNRPHAYAENHPTLSSKWLATLFGFPLPTTAICTQHHTFSQVAFLYQLLDSEDEGTANLKNTGNVLPIDTPSHIGKFEFSERSMFKTSTNIALKL